eukprot:12673_1
MSSQRKHKTSFKKKTTAETYWDDAEPQYTEEQKKRIASYLEENDENCKESTTLILFIVIGLLIALAIVGFLVIRNNSSIKYKGSHTTYEHASSNSTIMNLMWSKWNWLQGLYFGLNLNTTNSTASTIESQQIRAIVALEEELNDFQPIYRNPLLQQLYASDDSDCNDMSDDSVYNFISIKHGAWWPSPQYLEEALDFSWSDFESTEEKEEIELVNNIDKEDETEKDKKEKEELQKQIESDREKRKKERKKDKHKENRDPKENEAFEPDRNKRRERRKKEHEKAVLMEQNAKNKRRLLRGFDPMHALPNPANILMPHHKGDRGAGDVEADALHAAKMHNLAEFKKKQFPKGVMPGWLKDVKGGKHPHFDRHSLPFGNRMHLKHLDEMRNKKKHKFGLTPGDILKGIDLTKFGISSGVNDDTTDKEKRADLSKLEEEEEKRHPYVTLLTNPGDMEDVHCIKNEYRKHDVIMGAMSDDVTSTYDGKQSMFNYDSDMLMWYCYLVEIQQVDDMLLSGGHFRVNLSFSDVDMEIGFDYVDVYINSMLIDSVSGIGMNWEENEARPEFVYYMDREYVDRNGNALEVCMKIVTDGSITKNGFKSQFSVDFADPQISTWSEWSKCTTLPAQHYSGAKNDKHWNGDCGIGIHNKSVTACADSSSDVAPCTVGEKRVEYCVKANCYDFAMNVDPTSPTSAFKFNGHGRVDPDFADPYLVQRSTQESFNITDIESELSAVRDEIIARYPSESVLKSAVVNHYSMDDSKLRLGIRLARSLLLGDSFTVYTTGSSNTAGHENMFVSSWPMQFASIMRPVWKRVGYQGAAFVVKNHAEGGHLSTVQIGPCIPSLIGDDADVVFWESQMNDHGDAVSHSVENHFRNAITLPRRPLYHVMRAGKNGGGESEPCYGWLCGSNHGDGLLQSAYTDFGAGATQFFPTGGLATVNTSEYKEFETGYLYVSWHPGPTGHRVYAEMLAYHYLSCVLETFADIADLINDFDTRGKPIEAMLEILEDPPRSRTIPHDHVANQCDPVCTNATEAVCISGYATLGKPRYSLKRWREKVTHDEDRGHWDYDSWMANPQAFSLKQGGQGSCDIKNQWQSKTADSTQLKFAFEAKQYGFIALEGDDFDGKKVQIKLNEIDMKSGQIIDSNSQYKKCGDGATLKDNWMAKDATSCTIGGLKPGQKYQIILNDVQNGTPINLKNIRIY